MRRMRRLRARLLASRSGIRSPAYSAIFFPRRKWTVAKQPLPLIGDLRIERPCASFTGYHCTTTRNEFTAAAPEAFAEVPEKNETALRSSAKTSAPSAVNLLRLSSPFAAPHSEAISIPPVGRLLFCLLAPDWVAPTVTPAARMAIGGRERLYSACNRPKGWSA